MDGGYEFGIAWQHAKPEVQRVTTKSHLLMSEAKLLQNGIAKGLTHVRGAERVYLQGLIVPL